MRLRLSAAGVRGLVRHTLLLTPSGALSPGPLSASAAASGALLGPAAGLMVALGHMAFELPYVAALSLFAARMGWFLERYGRPLGLASAAFIALFAALLARDAVAAYSGGAALFQGEGSGSLLGAFALGLILTGTNPFFLLWWLSVGRPLVEGAARLWPRGLAVMYAAHVWMDFAWLAFLAWAARLLAESLAGYSALLAALSVVLAYYAARMAVESLRGAGSAPREASASPRASS